MSANLPSTQRALKVVAAGAVRLENNAPLPRHSENEVLVRVICVGLNPFDWKSLDMSPSIGSTWGCDFSGQVVTTGSNPTGKFHCGDRVGGMSAGNNGDEPDNGAFAEYTSVPADLLFKMPTDLTFEPAPPLGCGLSTIGLSLYYVLKLPLPLYGERQDPQYVLIYGGGTATGPLAI